MTFQFNFFNESKECVNESSHKVVNPAGYIDIVGIMPDHISAIADKIVISDSQNDISIYKRNLSDVKFHYAQNDTLDDAYEKSSAILTAVNSNSDLIPGVYEGGLKTWECTYDLILHLHRYFNKTPIDTRGWNILELGCGSGLPGIYCRLNTFAKNVVFQDYNDDVLYSVTVPNVLMNLCHKELEDDLTNGVEVELPRKLLFESNCEFVKGDWCGMSKLFKGKKFQLILSSETIYNCSSYKHILQIIRDCLAMDGMALFACKSIYFGCTGDLVSFMNYLNTNKIWEIDQKPVEIEIDIVAEFGIDSLKRNILSVRWKTCQQE